VTGLILPPWHEYRDCDSPDQRLKARYVLSAWRSPEELIEHGLGRSRLVLMNEAHHRLTRCVRTREVGRALLPVAHGLGVRHLAMEALWPAAAEQANTKRALDDDLPGYLAQPDMRALVTAALDLGWTLHAYEADFASRPDFDHQETQVAINWREDQQARNLGAVVASLAPSERLLAWCGGGHLLRRPYEVSSGEEAEVPRVWVPMGSLVAGYCGHEPFAIDQTITVAYAGCDPPWLGRYVDALRSRDGTAGFLAADLPQDVVRAFPGQLADAYLLSLDNALV
jgi:hypothetical protein